MNENLVSRSISSISKLNSKAKSPTKSNIKKAYQKEYILDLLTKPKEQRTKTDIKHISDYLSNKYDYFTKLKEIDDDVLKLEKICSVLNIESYSPGTNIINFGEEGDKFYIVLEGTVGVFIPTYPQRIMSISEYATYMKGILQIEQNELKYKRIDEKNSECKIDLQFLISVSSSEIAGSGSREMNFFIEDYDKLGEFGDGFKFGEIALIKKTARNATITAISNTKLLSIEKSDYNKSIRELEEKRLEKQLSDFKSSYPLFQYWTLNHLIKLFNCFSKQMLTKGDYLYRQNEDADCVYIILSGVFEVYSLVSFGWVDDFFEYIKEAKHNLIHFLDSNKAYKEKAIRDIFIKATTNVPESPCRYDPLKVAKITTSFEKDNDCIIDFTQEEEDLRDPYNLFKVHVKTINYRDVIGIEDALEVKKRFCFVRCVSPFAEVQRVKLYDFFRLINLTPDINNKNLIKSVIAEKKCILYYQIRKTIDTLTKRNTKLFETKVASYFNTKNEHLPKNVMRINKSCNKSLFLLFNHHSSHPHPINSNSIHKESYCDKKNNHKHQLTLNSKPKIYQTDDRSNSMSKPPNPVNLIKTSALSNYTLFTMEKNKEKAKESREPKKEITTGTSLNIHNKTKTNTTFNASLNKVQTHLLNSRSSNNRVASPLSTKSIASLIHRTANKLKGYQSKFPFQLGKQKKLNIAPTSISNVIKRRIEYKNKVKLNINKYHKSLESNYDVFQNELFKMGGVKRKVPTKEVFGTVYDENDIKVLHIESYGRNEKDGDTPFTTSHSKPKSISEYSMEITMKNYKTLRKSNRVLNINL